MSETNDKPQPIRYLFMYELATRWGCCTRTLSRYIQSIQGQIPMYVKNQRSFAPVQYKKIAELLGFEI